MKWIIAFVIDDSCIDLTLEMKLKLNRRLEKCSYRRSKFIHPWMCTNWCRALHSTTWFSIISKMNDYFSFSRMMIFLNVRSVLFSLWSTKSATKHFLVPVICICKFLICQQVISIITDLYNKLYIYLAAISTRDMDWFTFLWLLHYS